jgi:glycosyltransferase involved in cell wall biosynthesis
MPKEAIAAGERMRLRAELGIPADGVLVGMTGQLARIKGVWDFLDAAEILVRRGAPARFAYLGDDLKGNGEVRRDLERSVHSRHLADRITFLGYREDAHRLVPAFDVIAVPSHVEPLGNATLEAMASGRPVVGSRVGGIPEMLVDGWTGLLVPPNDPRDLADALAGLIAERELRETMGSRGRIRAERHFSVDVQAQVLREHYERAVARPSAH